MVKMGFFEETKFRNQIDSIFEGTQSRVSTHIRNLKNILFKSKDQIYLYGEIRNSTLDLIEYASFLADHLFFLILSIHRQVNEKSDSYMKLLNETVRGAVFNPAAWFFCERELFKTNIQNHTLIFEQEQYDLFWAYYFDWLKSEEARPGEYYEHSKKIERISSPSPFESNYNYATRQNPLLNGSVAYLGPPSTILKLPFDKKLLGEISLLMEKRQPGENPS